MKYSCLSIGSLIEGQVEDDEDKVAATKYVRIVTANVDGVNWPVAVG